MTEQQEPELPEGWIEKPFDTLDEAPSFYTDSEHDCDGTEGSEHAGDDDGNGHAIIRGGAGNAQDRGWGPGWPNCQSGKIVTIYRPDGIRLPVHKDIKVLIALLCDETERRGYNLVPGWCWGFACRAIRGSSSPSNHSWGLAVDLNAPTNPMTSPLRTDMPGWMPELWNSFGFRWGGDYSGRKDAMHYEFLGTPSDAVGLTKKAVLTLGGRSWDEMATKEELREVIEEILERRLGPEYKDANGKPLVPTSILVESNETGKVDGIKEIRREIAALDVPRKP